MRIKKILSLAVVLAMVLTVVPGLGLVASAAGYGENASSISVEFTIGDLSTLSVSGNAYADIGILDTKGTQITRFCLAPQTDGFFPFEREGQSSDSATREGFQGEKGVEYTYDTTKFKIDITPNGNQTTVKYTLTDGLSKKDGNGGSYSNSPIDTPVTAEYTYTDRTVVGVALPENWNKIEGGYAITADNMYNVFKNIKITVDGEVVLSTVPATEEYKRNWSSTDTPIDESNMAIASWTDYRGLFASFDVPEDLPELDENKVYIAELIALNTVRGGGGQQTLTPSIMAVDPVAVEKKDTAELDKAIGRTDGDPATITVPKIGQIVIDKQNAAIKSTKLVFTKDDIKDGKIGLYLTARDKDRDTGISYAGNGAVEIGSFELAISVADFKKLAAPTGTVTVDGLQYKVTGTKNLVTNPSFETVDGEFSVAGWKSAKDGTMFSLGANHGFMVGVNGYAPIDSSAEPTQNELYTPNGGSGWSFGSKWNDGIGPKGKSNGLCAIRGNFKAEPNKTYYISFYAKQTTDATAGYILQATNGNNALDLRNEDNTLYGAVEPTGMISKSNCEDWTKLEAIVSTDETNDTIQFIGYLMGQTDSVPGTLLDDFTMVEVERDVTGAPDVIAQYKVGNDTVEELKGSAAPGESYTFPKHYVYDGKDVYTAEQAVVEVGADDLDGTPVTKEITLTDENKVPRYKSAEEHEYEGKNYIVTGDNIVANGDFATETTLGWENRFESSDRGPAVAAASFGKEQVNEAEATVMSINTGGHSVMNSIGTYWPVENGGMYYLSFWIRNNGQLNDGVDYCKVTNGHKVNDQGNREPDGDVIVAYAENLAPSEWTHIEKVFTSTGDSVYFQNSWANISLTNFELVPVELDPSATNMLSYRVSTQNSGVIGPIDENVDGRTNYRVAPLTWKNVGVLFMEFNVPEAPDGEKLVSADLNLFAAKVDSWNNGTPYTIDVYSVDPENVDFEQKNVTKVEGQEEEFNENNWDKLMGAVNIYSNSNPKFNGQTNQNLSYTVDLTKAIVKDNKVVLALVVGAHEMSIAGMTYQDGAHKPALNNVKSAKVPTTTLTPELGWDGSKFTVNFTGELAEGEKVRVYGENAAGGEFVQIGNDTDVTDKEGVAVTTDATNRIYNAAVVSAEGLVGPASAKTSIYKLVVDALTAEGEGAVDPAKLGAINEVISKGGVYYDAENAATAEGKKLFDLNVAEEGTVTVTVKKTIADLGVGFVLANESEVYFGSVDGTKATVQGNADESAVYDVMTIDTEANTVTLSKSAGLAEAVTLSLDSVNIEFVETLIEEAEAANVDAETGLTPEL